MKRPLRGHRYRALAYGYKILKSPIADSFKAAAEHYDPTGPPLDRAGASIKGGQKEQTESARRDGWLGPQVRAVISCLDRTHGDGRGR